MSLKIALKPGEKVLIGSAVVVNGPSPAQLTLENKVPVLRQKDILTLDRARTACQKLYVWVQLMYIDPASARQYHEAFWELSRSIVGAAPSTLKHVEAIGDLILRDQHYQALKAARRLIEYEGELLKHAQKRKPDL